MLKKILLVLGLIPALSAGAQVNIPYTEVPYDVHYHWGLVDLMIARGLVTLQTEGSSFTATLDGNSIPWEGRIFCVSDTLQATMSPAAGLSRETVNYENGWYMKPKVAQYRSEGFDPSAPSSFRNIKGQGELSASASTMEAVTVTADMLGMFYYFREMDFDSMTAGQSINIPIEVPGGDSQEVVVTYLGPSSYDVGGSTYPTYALTFEYSYRGAMSGYPVHAEVSTSSRLPLLLSASLPAGHVEMIHNPD